MAIGGVIPWSKPEFKSDSNLASLTMIVNYSFRYLL